jgi:hypothetical protein
VALAIDSGAKSVLEDISVTAVYFQYDSSSMESAILLGLGRPGAPHAGPGLPGSAGR